MKKIETKPIFKIGDIIRHKKHGDKYRFTILKVLKDGYVVDDQLLITFNMADNWEVVESEDEKIRKDCISIIKAWETQCKLDGDICEVAPACIAWLEKQKPMEWSQEDLICLGYLADFVDKNGDAFYGKNKPTVVKWIRSFAELPTHTPIKDIEQKPAEWTEEDEQLRINACKFLDDAKQIDYSTPHKKDIDDCINWLLSIKDRCIPQPKVEWSEEDEKILEDVKFNFEYNKGKMTDALQEAYNKYFKKIKFLDPKVVAQIASSSDNCKVTGWKPSEEQMNALNSLLLKGKFTEIGQAPCLQSLYIDLKAL